MAKIKYFLLLLGCTVLLGCGKTKDEPELFPRAYYIVDVIKLGEPVFYIDGQVSTDKLEKEAFLQGESILNEDQRIIGSQRLVVFKTKDVVHFGGELEDWDVQKEGSQYVFTTKNYFTNERESYKSISELQKYRDESPLPVPNQGAGGIQYQSRAVTLAYGDADRLEVPYFAYKWEHSSAGAQFLYAGTVYNEFNEDFLHKNMPTEKLAIQKYTIRLQIK